MGRAGRRALHERAGGRDRTAARSARTLDGTSPCRQITGRSRSVKKAVRAVAAPTVLQKIMVCWATVSLSTSSNCTDRRPRVRHARARVQPGVSDGGRSVHATTHGCRGSPCLGPWWPLILTNRWRSPGTVRCRAGDVTRTIDCASRDAPQPVGPCRRTVNRCKPGGPRPRRDLRQRAPRPSCRHS